MVSGALVKHASCRFCSALIGLPASVGCNQTGQTRTHEQHGGWLGGGSGGGGVDKGATPAGSNTCNMKANAKSLIVQCRDEVLICVGRIQAEKNVQILSVLVNPVLNL